MTQNDIDYASRVFTESAACILKNHIKKIIMYGSCARGDFDSDSDAVVEYICLLFDEYNDKKGWYGYFKNIETEGRVLFASIYLFSHSGAFS